MSSSRRVSLDRLQGVMECRRGTAHPRQQAPAPHRAAVVVAQRGRQPRTQAFDLIDAMGQQLGRRQGPGDGDRSHGVFWTAPEPSQEQGQRHA